MTREQMIAHAILLGWSPRCKPTDRSYVSLLNGNSRITRDGGFIINSGLIEYYSIPVDWADINDKMLEKACE